MTANPTLKYPVSRTTILKKGSTVSRERLGWKRLVGIEMALRKYKRPKLVRLYAVDKFDMDALRVCPDYGEVLDGAYFMDEDTARFDLEKML
jgi:hypothetical protein